MLLCQLRMNLDTRLGILIDERTNPARLRAGKELADDPPRGQYHRKLGIDVFRGRTVLSDVEPRFAVGKIEGPGAARDRVPRTRLEESRRTGVVVASGMASRRRTAVRSFRT